MPERRKHQVHPVHPKDLVCDTCPERSPWMNTEGATEDRAVFKGWRVFAGPSMTGKPLKVACCPTCFRTGAPARPAASAPMEGQLDLPGLITPVPTGKKSKKRTNRAIS